MMRLCFVTFMFLVHQITAEDGCASVCTCSDNVANCSYVEIGSIPHRDVFNNNLKMLDLTGNFIEHLTDNALVDYEGLQNLSFRNNYIRDVNRLAFAGLYSSLVHLDLTGNKIQTIFDDTFKRIPELKTLLLSNNSVATLERNSFGDPEHLQYLDLSLNYLSIILDGTFDRNQELQFLSLRHNEIQSVGEPTFKMLHNLRHLDLSHNKISSVQPEAFRSLSQLEWFSLSHNRIKEFYDNAFESLGRVKYFDLSQNEIRVINPLCFANCSSLETLSIAHNNIGRIREQGLYGLFSLRHFDLSHNRLAHLSPDVFISGDLPPANNHGGTVCSEYNSLSYSLIVLKLDNNGISSLDKCVFVPTRGLQEIGLGANNLSALDHRTFLPLRDLTNLDLSFNRLSEVDDLAAEWMLRSATAVNLTGNPWDCTCGVLYSAYKVLRADKERNITLVCERPEEGRGEPWNVLEEICERTTTEDIARTSIFSATYEVTGTEMATTAYTFRIKRKFNKTSCSKVSSIAPSGIFVIFFAVAVCWHNGGVRNDKKN
ncbi:chondroadherin-like isoform X2 [Zootermopsis nevadensis]|uniref:chondroadherin-like isoform X2 n=1 Tax=Zootermopsis nevadensis TaxID=136037 RepID=UPI000B8E5B3C|nr:chondroadherin-like isoform X2 [Zootermopsis nevadensis]